MWPDLAIYWTLGNFSKPLATINLPKSSTVFDNFCVGAKIFNFSSEIVFGQLLWTFGDFSLVTLFSNDEQCGREKYCHFSCCCCCCVMPMARLKKSKIKNCFWHWGVKWVLTSGTSNQVERFLKLNPENEVYWGNTFLIKLKQAQETRCITSRVHYVIWSPISVKRWDKKRPKVLIEALYSNR